MSAPFARAVLVAAVAALAACNADNTTVDVKSRVEFTATVDHFVPAGESALGIGELTAR